MKYHYWNIIMKRNFSSYYLLQAFSFKFQHQPLLRYRSRLQSYFSTSPNQNLSTEEKAAEITKELIPKWKYYIALCSPVFAGMIWLIFIVNNKYIKEKSETIAPWFVELVRKYYGLSEENIEENKNIKNILLSQNQNYAISAILDNSESIFIGNVSGQESIISIQSLLFEKLGDDLKKVYDFRFEMSTLDNDMINEIIDNVSHNENSSTSHGYSSFINGASLWHTGSNISHSYSPDEILKCYRNELENIPTPFYRKGWLVQRYENIILDFMKGIDTFKSYGNLNLNYTSRNPKSLNRTISKETTIAQVKREISRLELINDILLKELQVGRRPIDSIAEDQKHIRNEITRLKRRYLNYFYFF